ncbi:MAG TPA: CBS domain-containing protein [Streptosporangiaceae bacterium]|jgi:CBS domain-containing protein
MSATVKDVMTADVVAVRSDTSFKHMASLLSTSRISALPVLDAAEHVIGVVSEADMLIKEADQASYPGFFTGLRRRRDHEKAAGISAADLMTSPPIVIRPDEPVQRAARLMYERGVKRLLVVDDAGHLLGIVSRSDVLGVFSRPDEEIRREVAGRVILQSFLTDPALFDITVQDGIVTMAGRPETNQVGKELVEAVRRLDGVVAVHDQLSYPD